MITHAWGAIAFSKQLVLHRIIPVHILADKLVRDVCKVLPALHILTRCDMISRVGTKSSAKKANPVQFLGRFGSGMSPTDSDIAQAEAFLVHVLQNGATMGELLSCKQCATQRCRCKKSVVPCICCGYRQQDYYLHGPLCKNPNLMLRLPISVQVQ